LHSEGSNKHILGHLSQLRAKDGQPSPPASKAEALREAINEALNTPLQPAQAVILDEVPDPSNNSISSVVTVATSQDDDSESGSAILDASQYSLILEEEEVESPIEEERVMLLSSYEQYNGGSTRRPRLTNHSPANSKHSPIPTMAASDKPKYHDRPFEAAVVVERSGDRRPERLEVDFQGELKLAMSIKRIKAQRERFCPGFLRGNNRVGVKIFFDLGFYEKELRAMEKCQLDSESIKKDPTNRHVIPLLGYCKHESLGFISSFLSLLCCWNLHI